MCREHADDAADDLRDHVEQRVPRRDFLADREAKGRGGIEMRPGRGPETYDQHDRTIVAVFPVASKMTSPSALNFRPNATTASCSMSTLKTPGDPAVLVDCDLRETPVDVHSDRSHHTLSLLLSVECAGCATTTDTRSRRRRAGRGGGQITTRARG